MSDTNGRTSTHEEDDLPTRITGDLSANTAVITDLYRGEIERMTTWRARLDQTTNWAVVLVAAILTWAFSSPDNPHYVILIGIFGTTGFLLMEAHRYREYDAWRDRVRSLQSNLIADVVASERSRGDDWQAHLAEDLRRPRLEISVLQAVNHRLRRSYLALLLVLLLAWTARIAVFQTGEPWHETASIFVLPGRMVVGVLAVFYAIVIGIVVVSAYDDRMREFQQ
jgi:uncharacterized membrane protein